MRHVERMLLAFALMGAPALHASTAITYQGELRNAGTPVTANYDFRFVLYDADVGGSQLGSIVTQNAVPVSAGVFTVVVDFGAAFSGGGEQYVEISAKPAGGPSYTVLSPRQHVTRAPIANALQLPYADTGISNGTLLDVANGGDGQAAAFSSGSSFVSLYAANVGSGGALRADTSSSGTGSAITGYNYGNDRYAAELEIIKVTNPRAAIYARTAGTGQAIDAEVNSSTTADALFARTTSPTAGSYAGVFSGPVQVSCSAATCNTTNALQVVGNFAATMKNFIIDHPLDPANKYLYHTSVESPDMKNVYDGVARLDASGEATVELPEWFEALNRDYRYQLTSIGAPAPNLYVSAKVRDNRFRIGGGVPGGEVSWQVTGIRQDAYARRYPAPVEQMKAPGDRGHYLVPEAFGLPASLSIRQDEAPVMPAVER